MPGTASTLVALGALALWLGWSSTALAQPHPEPSIADPHAGVAALSTRPGAMSVFAVGIGGVWALDYDPQRSAWAPPVPLLGGFRSSDVTALSTVEGGASLFVFGYEEDVISAYRDPRTTGQWTEWFTLGGGRDIFWLTETKPTHIAAISTVPGGTSLFAVGKDDGVWSNYYDPRDANPRWVGWFPLGAVVRPDSHVSAVSSLAGGSSVFVVGLDGAVWANEFDPQAPSPQWGSWYSLGGSVKQGTEITAISTVDDGITLFMVGAAGDVQWNYRLPGQPLQAWSGWISLGGVVKDGASVSAVSAVDDGTQIFVVGLDDAVWSRFFDPRSASPQWVDWFSLGGIVRGQLDISAVSPAPGSTTIFVRNTDGYISAAQIDLGATSLSGPGWYELGR